MSGRWTIATTDSGSTKVSYFDFTTRKSWACGEAPADLARRATTDWVLSQCRYGDVIVDGATVLVVSQPEIELPEEGDHDGAEPCE